MANAGPIKLLPGKNRAFVDFIIEQFAEKGGAAAVQRGLSLAWDRVVPIAGKPRSHKGESSIRREGWSFLGR